MSMIVDNIINATDACEVTYIIFKDMGSVIANGSPEAYLLLYAFLFIILPMIGLSVARGPLFGLLAGTAGHFSVILLGSGGCLPLPAEYLIIGNFIYLFMAGIFYYLYKYYKGEINH